jgi:surfactin synthase thioesterase subunit
METRLVLGLPFHTLKQTSAAKSRRRRFVISTPRVSSDETERGIPAVSEKQMGSLVIRANGRAATYTAQGKLKAVMMPIVPIGFQTCKERRFTTVDFEPRKCTIWDAKPR